MIFFFFRDIQEREAPRRTKAIGVPAVTGISTGVVGDTDPGASGSMSARKALTFTSDSKAKPLPLATMLLTSPERPGKTSLLQSSVPVTKLTLGKPSPQKTQDSFLTGLSGELDSTDYLVPPGTSPLYPKQDDPDARESKGAKAAGATVKELLTPLADRMQDQYRRLSQMGTKNAAGTSQNPHLIQRIKEQTASSADPENHPQTLPELTGDPELDSTLVDDDASCQSLHLPAAEVSRGKNPDQDLGNLGDNTSLDSRYSMTDYFRKYSATDPELEKEDIQPRDLADYDANDPDVLLFVPDTESNNTELSEQPSKTGEEGAYKDTPLDMSMNSIADTMSTVSGITGCLSASETAFQQGLEDLDMNIARIQKELRQKIYNSVLS